MADGDITANKVLYRQTVGAGQDADGVQKNTKVLVVGELTCTYHSSGIAVNKLGTSAFGVSNVDFIHLNPITIAGASPITQKLFKADYDHANQKIFLLEDVGQANPAIPSNADACVIKYVVLGDDAGAPELT